MKSKLPVLTIFVLLLLLALSACGKKGPVRPLIKPLPAAPTGFFTHQAGNRVLLSWTIPSVNQDGSKLDDLLGFHLYRIEYEEGSFCPECRDPEAPLHRFDLDYLEEVRRDGQRLSFWDTQVRPGVGYRYRLRAVTRKGFEGEGSTLQRVVRAAPPAPEGLSGQPGDRKVQLRWRTPEELAAGDVLLGFNVYRSTGDVPLPEKAHNITLILAPEFDDYGLDNNTPYRYAVRSVVRSGGEVVESEASAEVVATPGLEP